MELKPTTDRMLKYACPVGELSCIIGNLFVELLPPCEHCCEKNQDDIVIKGITFTGEEASLIIKKDCFYFDGNPETLAELRQRRCTKIGK